MVTRKFHKKFRQRIPRKLKKAAKYGVERYTKPIFSNSNNAAQYPIAFYCREETTFKIKGRRTKWKIKALAKCIIEYNLRLLEMWRQSNNMIMTW